MRTLRSISTKEGTFSLPSVAGFNAARDIPDGDKPVKMQSQN